MRKIFLEFCFNCRRSRLGRIVFVAHLIYSMAAVGYFYNHLADVYPFFFFGERELFVLFNLPQIVVVNDIRNLFGWHANKLSDAVAMVYISFPWWIYGYIAESVIGRLSDDS